MANLISKLVNSPWAQVTSVHLAEYRRKPLLNLGFILSLAIATATLLSILVLNHASKTQYQQAHSQLKPNVAFGVVAREGSELTYADYNRLKRLGFSQLQAVLTIKQPLSGGQTLNIRAFDMLPLVLMDSQNYTSQQLVMSQGYAEKLALTSEDEIALRSGARLKFKISESQNWAQIWGNTALMDIGLAQLLFPEHKYLSYLTSPQISQVERQRLEQALPPHLSIRETWTIEQRAGFADALHLNLSALAILGFIVSLFIAYQAANQAWAKRSSLALQLRLLGVDLLSIKRVMLLEGVILTLLATLIGIGLAQALVSALLPLLGLTLEQIYQLTTSGHFEWHWQYSLWAFGLSGLAVVVSLRSQFRRISSANVALQARTASQPFNFRRISLTALGLALLAGLWPSGDWYQLMIKYGLVLLASVAFLPLLMRSVLRLLASLSRSFFLSYLFQDAAAQVGRRYLPIAAFYLALTSSIAAALMISSFESSFKAYLNQILRADMFITHQPEQEDKVEAWLSTNPQLAEFAKFQRTTAKIEQDTVHVFAIGTTEQYASMLLKQGALPLANDPYHACYINEQLALKRGFHLQDQITVSQGQDKLQCIVTGIYYDYGAQTLGIRVSATQALDALSGWHTSGYGLYAKPNETLASEQVKAELNLGDDQLYEPQQVKTLALDIFNQTFLLTQAIAFVLLSIACFGLFLSANSLELARKNDLHILSSLGYSKRGLFSHMLIQWLLLILSVIAISWPVALILAHALVSQVLPASFGWSMPLVFDMVAFAASSAMGLLLLLPALGFPLYKINVKASLS